jgi:hypothetical protein
VTSLRDRTRSVQRRLLEIVRASRDNSEKGQQKLTAAYRKLLDISSRVGERKNSWAAMRPNVPVVS